MKKYTIKRKFSKNGVESLIRLFNKLIAEQNEFRELFEKFSLEYLENQAKQYIDATVGQGSYVPTGNLKSSFIIDYNAKELMNNAFVVTASGHSVHYAAMVEYGTGAFNSPTEPNGYSGSGKTEWTYPFDAGGEIKMVHTMGIQPHRFMYNAIQDYIHVGKDICFERAFSKVFGGSLK